jgi:hypothetical protein
MVETQLWGCGRISDLYQMSYRGLDDARLPPDCPQPQPTQYWPPENVALLVRYGAWPTGGGVSSDTQPNPLIPNPITWQQAPETW